MRKIFNGTYKHLDDDVSFQILRTNPRLSTNTKLMYDGESMYLESYDANELLSTQKYKNKQIWKSGLYNNDIKNFLQGTGSSAFIVGNKMRDTIVGNDYAYQYENMYWCGAEAVTSKVYSQEFGIVAPLYIRKKLPNYFVVFKVEGVSNFNMVSGDDSFDFNDDIFKKMHIVKSFDLREGTVIGDYIKNYVSQSTFEYDKSMYVNFSTNEIYYYGIDLTSGLLTKKVENFTDELVWADNTILHDDDWFTNGYARNNLAFPYIINFEFVFDDNETDDYKFCRYFGFYCDDIDLFEFDNDSDICLINKMGIYYLKDKNDNLHESIKFKYRHKSYEYGYLRQYEYTNNDLYDDVDGYDDVQLKGRDVSLTFNNTLNLNEGESYSINYSGESIDFISMFKALNESKFKDNSKFNEKTLYKNGRICISDKNVNEDDFGGYHSKTMSAYCNYVDGVGYASYTFSVDKKFNHGDYFSLILDGYNKIDFIASEYEIVYNNPSDNVIIPDLSSDVYEYVGICNEQSEMFSYTELKYDKNGKLVSPEITVNLCDFRYFNEETGTYEYKHNLPLFKIGDKKLVTWEYRKDDNGNYSFETIENVDDSFGYGIIFKDLRISQLSDYAKCEVADENIMYFNGKNKNGENQEFINSITIHNSNGLKSEKLYRKSRNISADETISNRFSCSGGIGDIAKNICDCINSYHHSSNYYRAKSYNNIVVIRYAKPGSEYNERLKISFSENIEKSKKVSKYNMNGDDKFSGGTDIEGCRFKVRISDINYFIGEDGNCRYIKTLPGYDDAKIVSYGYNIDEFGDIDSEYLTIITDSNGKYIKISDIKQVEILDRFYPKFGILSFFPVKDFDFDTLYSPYCDESVFTKELESFSENIDLKKFYSSDDFSKIEMCDEQTKKEIKRNLMFDNIKQGRLFTDDMTPLQSEYDYFYENIIPQLCTVSKTTGHIAKWGYVDGMDSCENPYRLNCSKVFGVDNLSANLFKYGGFKTNFTHDMPYYMNTSSLPYLYIPEEYSYVRCYINSPEDGNMFYKYRTSFNNKIKYSEVVDGIISKFKNEEKNYFDLLFRIRDNYKDGNNNYLLNKRSTKKYSKFKHGNEYQNANTLFRGVKFDVCKLVNGKDTFTSIYNDYDFSFLLIPIVDNDKLSFKDDIYIVKNDKFKFIVAFIVCSFPRLDNDMFNKSFVYAGCNDLIKIDVKSSEFDNLFKYNREEGTITVSFNFSETFYCNNVINNVYSLKDVTIISPILKTILETIKGIMKKVSIKEISIRKDNGEQSYQLYSQYGEDEISINGFKLKINSKINDDFIIINDGDKYDVEIKLYVSDKDNKNDILFNKIFNVYKDLSAFSIKEKINNNYNVHYSSDDFRLRVILPNTIETLDVFKGALISSSQNNSGVVVSSAEIIPKTSINQMRINRINRYSGYYQPIYKDILFFDDVTINKFLKYSNTYFATTFGKIYNSNTKSNEYNNAGSFGIIKNMYFHKINEDKGNTLFKTLEPYYPLTGEYAIDNNDYNIFSSSWDMNYYTKQKDINTSEKCNYIASVDNSLCMFGSKYMNVPERIELDVFLNCEPWNENFIINPDYSNSEIMYREVDNKKVEYCLFIKKRLMRYFTKDISGIRNEFSKLVKDEYSYGRKDTIDDDIERFVEDNLIKLYRLNAIRMYVKSVKRGVNDLSIENDYVKYTNNTQSQLIKEGFVQNKSFRINNIGNNELDRKITYDLTNGNQEYFGFKIYLIKK